MPTTVTLSLCLNGTPPPVAAAAVSLRAASWPFVCRRRARVSWSSVQSNKKLGSRGRLLPAAYPVEGGKHQEGDLDRNPVEDEEEVKDVGVKAALYMLRFYKREISPLMRKSCRYVPTCSEYSMQAYKRYGVVKGTILTTWRLCRCNPLGGHGFDPPRWFGEEEPPEL